MDDDDTHDCPISMVDGCTGCKFYIDGKRSNSCFIVRLKYQKSELLKIFNLVPALIFYKDDNNCFIKCNKAHCETLDRSNEEIEGKTCWELHTKEDADRYFKDDREVMDSGKAKLNYIETYTMPDGTVRHFQTSKIPYRDAEGKIIGIIGFALEITEVVVYKDQLEELVEERTKELEEAKLKLKKQNEKLNAMVKETLVELIDEVDCIKKLREMVVVGQLLP